VKINALQYTETQSPFNANLQAALNAAADGDRIYLPSPQVYVAPAGALRIRKRIELYGDGPGTADSPGTVIVPHAPDEDVLVIEPGVGEDLANLYLHDFRIDGQTIGRDGIRCASDATRKISQLNVERVVATSLRGLGFSLLGVNGNVGAIVQPRLFECVASDCAGGGASLRYAFLASVTHSRFQHNGTSGQATFGLRAEQSGVAVYACVLDGNEGTEGQMWLVDCHIARVDACRLREFALGASPSAAITLTRCPGAVVGGCYFELSSAVAGSVGIDVFSDALAGPLLILPNRFKGVQSLVQLGTASLRDIRGAVVLPQFDDGTSGTVLLPQDTNRGLTAVPHVYRPSGHQLAGLILPENFPSGDPTGNVSDGMLAYDSAKRIRARSGTWKTVRIVPPAAVTDLSIPSRGRHSLVVRWTAPTGNATEYILKRSTNPITDANFDSATTVTAPSPGPPGTQECVTEAGLTTCTLYYYAVKSRDSLNNDSPISNLPSASTLCSGSVEVECE